MRDALSDYRLDPRQLTLELTEGIIINDLRGTVAKMQALKTLGVRLSIDDFGTGFSSLAYLKQLPIDELKIDRSFVQDAPHNSDDAALVDAILGVSRQFRLLVVGEGVETEEQFDFLKARRCDHYQGYLFGRPIPAQTFIDQTLARFALAISPH